jgi:acetyl esterase
MPQPLGGVFGLVKFAMKLGLAPDPAKALSKPHDERLKRVTPGFMIKPGPAVGTQDVIVEGRDGPVPARVYTRPGTKPGTPAILFIHGGGFVDCGVDFCDNVQRGLAQRTGYVVVGLSYRLAPEHPFPAALHDCADVLQWMHDTRPGGLDPQRIAVGGESAGGNLTVALCLYARDNNGPAIAHQSVYYPFTDTSLTSPDWDSGLMPGVDRKAAEMMVQLYGGDDPHNPLVNVLGADLHGLPPATVITCGHDVLHTDGVRLVEALRAAGVQTLHTHYDDMPHGFLMYSRLTKRADESMDEMAREAGQRLGVAEALSG